MEPLHLFGINIFHNLKDHLEVSYDTRHLIAAN